MQIEIFPPSVGSLNAVNQFSVPDWGVVICGESWGKETIGLAHTLASQVTNCCSGAFVQAQLCGTGSQSDCQCSVFHGTLPWHSVPQHGSAPSEAFKNTENCTCSFP